MNKNVFVTGATSGIGLEFSRLILKDHDNLFMCVRNLKKASIIKQELLLEYPNAHIKILELDISDFNSIENFVNYIITNKINIDTFYNNAGIYKIRNQFDKQGYELVMGTNFIGTYYLTKLLLPYLTTLDNKVNYIFTTSLVSYFTKMPKNGLFEKTNNLTKIYGQSKRANIHSFMYFLEKYNNSNINFKLVHPGACYTNLVSNMFKSKFMKNVASSFMNLFCNKVKDGALITYYSINNYGLYFGPKGLLGLKGKPKELKLKKCLIKGYLDTINEVEKLL